MRQHCLIPVLTTFIFLTSCAHQAQRINPSTASIQELTIQADGQWRFRLRIQNFSNIPMHYSALKASVEIAGTDVGNITLTPDLDIVAESADVFEITLKVSATLPNGDIDYVLKGDIDTSQPKGHFPFEYKSRLSPVPGLPHAYR